MKLKLIIAATLLAAACGNSPTPIDQNTQANAGRGSDVTDHDLKPQSVIDHSPQQSATPPANTNTARTKWTAGGDPIDTSASDAAIAGAMAKVKKAPKDAAANKELAEAYLVRAEQLTEARQYASALGDYRRTLKYQPDNEDAKQWVEKIIVIYDGLNKDAPKEGEEPPPLPYKKEANTNK